jgi:hypothetical protein
MLRSTQPRVARSRQRRHNSEQVAGSRLDREWSPASVERGAGAGRRGKGPEARGGAPRARPGLPNVCRTAAATPVGRSAHRLHGRHTDCMSERACRNRARACFQSYTHNPTRYTLRPTRYTLRPTRYTLRPTRYALRTAHYALHDTLYAPHAARNMRLITHRDRSVQL